VGFELRFFLKDLNHGLDMAWSDPSHLYFRFLYDSLRGAHRTKGGSFTLLFTWRPRGEKWRWEWKQRMREERVPLSMEGSRRLWLLFICGVHTCLEEGAL
jgi:hypothetical protein